MMIPSHVIELDEPNAPFRHPPRQETICGIGPSGPRVLAVEPESRIRFAADIGQFGDAGLHLEGHLVLPDPRIDFGIAALRGPSTC